MMKKLFFFLLCIFVLPKSGFTLDCGQNESNSATYFAESDGYSRPVAEERCLNILQQMASSNNYSPTCAEQCPSTLSGCFPNRWEQATFLSVTDCQTTLAGYHCWCTGTFTLNRECTSCP
ncbi:MAG TPA: hypothetical protein VJL87_05120 [Bdellovibrionota bacterium]|nr:hypothetical protein [Bdellovibrionota bacterium]